MGSSLRTRIVTMPIRIGVRLAKVGPPPWPPSSAWATAAAAAANEEAPARCSKLRRVRSRFIVSVLPGWRWMPAVYYVFDRLQPVNCTPVDHIFVDWTVKDFKPAPARDRCRARIADK